jgi:hypothetical protein
MLTEIQDILRQAGFGITGEGIDSCGRSTVFFQYPSGFGLVSIDEFCFSVSTEFGHQGTAPLEQLDQELPRILGEV